MDVCRNEFCIMSLLRLNLRLFPCNIIIASVKNQAHKYVPCYFVRNNYTNLRLHNITGVKYKIIH